MFSYMERLMIRIKTAKWAFKIAWKTDGLMMCIWFAISIGLSVLPAISLYFNREIINALSTYIDSGNGTYNELIPKIIVFGIILTFIGFSSRLNGDFIYIMMYNSYYIGMQEILMNGVQEVDMIDLLKGEINDEYSFAVNRAGSLTDFISGFCALMGKVISILFFLVIAFNTSKIIFFITLTYIISIVFINIFFADKIRWNAQKIFGDERIANYFAYLPRDIGIGKEIRIYENMEEIVTQWEKSYKNVEKSENKRGGIIELHNFIGEVSFYLFTIAVVIYMIIILAKGNIDITIFLVIYTLGFNIHRAISGLTREIYGCDYGLFALEKQHSFFSYIKKIKKAANNIIPDNFSNVYKLNNVGFSYLNGTPVLQNINFEIKKGEVVALVGKNGSGKSTLAKLLLNLYTPSVGSIQFYDIDFNEYKKDEIRQKIGAFFQDFFIFHETVYDNIAYGDIESVDKMEKIQDAIHKGGTNTVIEKLPLGLDTFLGNAVEKHGSQLSGGESQRVAVARAHMSNKDILIFDEPAAALDPIAEMEQFVNIRNKLKDRTAILISHRVGFARMADKIIMMEEGKIVEMGKHQELMDANGSYAQFFNNQAEWYITKKEDGEICE